MKTLYPILLADVGGTNARFSLMEEEGSSPRHLETVNTNDFESAQAAVVHVLTNCGVTEVNEAYLAIAGPIIGETYDLTKSRWHIKPQEFLAETGIRSASFMNDFVAQALAVDAISINKMVKVGGGSPRENSTRVVMGPGTSFGLAALVNCNEVISVIPSEAAHVDMGLGTGRHVDREKAIEQEIRKFNNRQAHDRLVVESYLSGLGLENLRAAVCAADGLDASIVKASEVTASASRGDDQASVEAVSIFARILGRVAGDYALNFFSFGGVFVSGGMAAKMLPLITASEFREEFEHKLPHENIVQAIPTYMVNQELAAIEGLAHLLNSPGRYDLSHAAALYTIS